MKNDLRYERTESLIFDSLFKLISKKSFDSVSVTDICKSARISRNAFYAHYMDKFDLMNKITNIYLDKLSDEIRNMPENTAFSDAINFTAKQILVFFSENKSVLSVLIKNNPFFWDRMNDEMEKITLSYVGTSEKNIVYAKYSSCAVCGCIKQFILNKMPLSEENFVKHLSEIAKETNRFVQVNLSID